MELTGEWRTGSDRELHGLMWSALRSNDEGGVVGYVAACNLEIINN